jgi:hypothetical protein
MLAKLFGGRRNQESKSTKIWKKYEKRGIEAESRKALNDAVTFYQNALEEIQMIVEEDSRHERYFAFKISQIRFALERVKTQVES